MPIAGRLAPRCVVSYGAAMTQSSDDDERSARVDAALHEYVLLRNRDLDLWRRAGLIAQLSHSSMLALVAILRADLSGAPLRQVDVQRLLRLSPAGTSTLTTELEERHLVRRVAVPADRRAFHLRTGPAAVPIAAQITAFDGEIRALLSELPAESLEPVIRLFTGMRSLIEDTYAMPAPEPEGTGS